MKEVLGSLPEVITAYKNYNLLVPTATDVQLNPFYKFHVEEVPVDLGENSGDIFKVGSVKTGKQDEKGKDIWEDVFSLSKPLLNKMAMAAGIQFNPKETYGERIDRVTYRAQAQGAMRKADGTARTETDQKVICLEDEEEKYRIEFADKAAKGITDEKQAQAAAEIFSGQWVESKNKWGKKCQAFVVAKEDRDRYVERSVIKSIGLAAQTAPSVGAFISDLGAMVPTAAKFGLAAAAVTAAVVGIGVAVDNYNQKALGFACNSDIQKIVDYYSEKPTNFEGLCSELFESLGYIAKLTPPTNDGGYDILLTRGGEKTIVECKCYSIGHKVGRPNIQKLVGANNVVLADKMIFITTSDFSGAAISYAEEVEVKLINGNKLMELLHKQGFIEKEKVKINVMECQLETADLYPYVPRDIYESFFE